MSLAALSAADRRVLGILMDCGPMSRAELADAIGVSRPATTQMIASLDRAGLVEEGESRKGGRGQPSRPVRIRGAAGYSAGISFSHSYLDAVIIDLTGRTVSHRRAPLTEPTPEAVAQTARHALADAKAAAADKIGNFIGIGFALPGDFRSDPPRLLAHRYFPAFDQLEARSFFQDFFDEPVFVENDGRTCAMGERLAGLGRSRTDFMVVHLGHGVGGGLFLHNRLYRGAHFNAGPVGTFFPLDQPRPSGQDLLETLRREGIDAQDFDRLETLSQSEWDAVTAWSLRAGAQLAPCLQHLANFIDPQVIIVGGRLPTRILSAIVTATGMPQSFNKDRGSGEPPIVQASLLGAQAGAIGAASVPVINLLLP